MPGKILSGIAAPTMLITCDSQDVPRQLKSWLLYLDVNRSYINTSFFKDSISKHASINGAVLTEDLYILIPVPPLFWGGESRVIQPLENSPVHLGENEWERQGRC